METVAFGAGAQDEMRWTSSPEDTEVSASIVHAAAGLCLHEAQATAHVARLCQTLHAHPARIERCSMWRHSSVPRSTPV